MLLYYGADWCPPCRNIRPTVEKIVAENQAKGLKTVFLMNDDNKFRSQKLDEEKRLGIRFAMATLKICPPGSCPGGARGDLGEFGRLYKLPSAFLLDSKGVVRERLQTDALFKGGIEAAVARVMSK